MVKRVNEGKRKISELKEDNGMRKLWRRIVAGIRLGWEGHV